MSVRTLPTARSCARLAEVSRLAARVARLADSPAIDAGGDTAVNLGLDMLTTRSDEAFDAGLVDLGYHFPITGNDLVMGDFDRNGRIDLADFSGFQNCFAPQGDEPASPSCRIFDSDLDLSVTLGDYAWFQKRLLE